jgi:hypothetical protein
MERSVFMLKTRISLGVVVLFVAGFFGLHAWTKYLAKPARSGTLVENFEPKHDERARVLRRSNWRAPSLRMVSKVALAMFLDEDMDILAQYHTGKRTNPRSAELSKRSSRILVRIH